MTSSENKNKRNGIVGTILFHALLLLSFLFMGLTYKIPPPPEEGISVNFGFEDVLLWGYLDDEITRLQNTIGNKDLSEKIGNQKSRKETVNFLKSELTGVYQKKQS